MRTIKTVLIVLLLAVSACKSSEKKGNDICVSIPPLKYFTSEIVGDKFDISVLIPPGASPETYEPTISDMKKASIASLIITIGAMECEESISKYADQEKILALNKNFSGRDPHFWLSIDGAKSISKDILYSVTALDPLNKEIYQTNYDALIQKIDSLERYATKKFDSIPQKDRAFILFHPTLGYLASQYSLEQIAIEHEGKEPTIAGMKEIISRAKKDGIKEILIQKEFDSSSIESIKNETLSTEIIIEPLSDQWLKNMYLIVDTLAYSMRNRGL